MPLNDGARSDVSARVIDTEESAQKLKERAQAVVEKAGDVLAGATTQPADDKGAFSASPARDAKALAEERLREMMREASTSGSNSSEETKSSEE